jgi:hypothetical protein
MHSVLFVGNNSAILQLDRLQDDAGVFQNDATVTVTAVTTAAGSAVSGISVPIALAYVPGSNGRYEAALSGVPFAPDALYLVTFRAQSVAGKNFEAVEQVLAKVRRA